jgi:hypothetical protein
MALEDICGVSRQFAGVLTCDLGVGYAVGFIKGITLYLTPKQVLYFPSSTGIGFT